MRLMLSICGGEAEGREGGRELDSDQLLGTRKQWVKKYLVCPDVGEQPQNLDEEDAMAATGVPALRTLENSAFLIGKFARELDSVNGIWEVVCYFDSAIPTDAPGLEWWWDAETIEKVIMRDAITGAPICNAVGEPLLVTRPVTIPILIVERIETSFDPDTILNFCDHTNESDFCGAPSGCALMGRILDAPVYQGGQSLRRVTYNIKFDLSRDPETGQLKGWLVSLLNHGSKFKVEIDATFAHMGNKGIELFPSETHFINFRDQFKNPTTGNLRANGSYLRDGEEPPVYLDFNRFPKVEFDALNINPYSQ